MQKTDVLAKASKEIREGISEGASASESLLNKTIITANDIGKMAKGITEISTASSTVLILARDAQTEIKQIIIDILKGTEAAIVSMTEQNKIINQGANEVNEAGVIFEQMKQTFSMVKDKVEGISLETVDLDEQGVNAVLEVQAAQNNAALVKDRAGIIAATAASQMKIMEETAKLVRELRMLAERMEELAGKFKVK